MKKIRKQAIILTFTLVFILIFSGTVSAAEWTVGPDVTYNYQAIQAAVDGSSDNDTITVSPNGTSAYTENVVVNKSGLLIRASGLVTVQPKNQFDPVFYIDSNGNNSTIQGFNIRSGGYDNNYYGIGLIETNGCRIISNNILNANQAIYADRCTNLTIDGNTISNSNSVGIYVYTSPGSSNNKAINNILTGNREGIDWYGTSNGEISGNTISNSKLVGMYIHHSLNNLITGNTVTGTQIAPGTYDCNGDGIFLATGSNSNTIFGNTISNNSNNGIHLWYACNDNNINGNNITSNSQGIYLDQLNGVGNNINKIIGNTINNNLMGVYLRISSNGNTISGNTLNNNLNGIYIYSSYNNLITENHINGNSSSDLGVTLDDPAITGNQILGNTITGYNYGIVSNAQSAEVHFNRIIANRIWGLIETNIGTVNATYNWWGTNSNVGTFINSGSGTVYYTQWLFMTINATPSTIINSGNSLITVSFNNFSLDGTSYTTFDPAVGHIPDGVPVIFSLTNGPLGNFDSLASPVTLLTSGGLASILFNATSAGIQNVNAETDNQIVPTSITIYNPASIGDHVWNDINRNGIQDAGESGLPGVTVNLYDNTNAIIDTTTTDASGNYIFTNLIPGTYSVGFVLPSGYVFSPQNQGGNDVTDSDADTATGRTITTILTSGENDLTWDAGMHIFTTTSLIVDNVSGNKGQNVYLKAKLIDDNTGNGIPGQTISFKVFGVDAGTAVTGADGVATSLPYTINLVGGLWDIDAAFAGTTTLADSYGTGSLKVNQSSIYVITTVSKTNPAVGEIVTLTFKLGNGGPDPADNVVFTYVIPEGMEFVGIETQPGYPEPVYDSKTRTITWTLGTVPKLDPWFKFYFRNSIAGTFNVNPTVTTATYDPGINNNVQSITINAVEVNTTVKAATEETVEMQETGLPIAGLILAVLALFGGLVTSKRK